MYAFAYCPNLTSLSIPKSVKKIGISAFINCNSLKSISIPSSAEIPEILLTNYGDAWQGNNQYKLEEIENFIPYSYGSSVPYLKSIKFNDYLFHGFNFTKISFEKKLTLDYTYYYEKEVGKLYSKFEDNSVI